MRRLLPHPPTDLTDIAEVYRSYRLPDGTGAHLRINMVSSVDGHVTDGDGVSGSLGGDGDLMAFRVLRHQADAILVGAGTVRAEDYGGMVLRDDLRSLRRADGRVEPAPIVVVTTSGDLDPTSRLFAGTTAPIIVTTDQCPASRRQALRDAGGTVVIAGDQRVDLPDALSVLRDQHGLAHVLAEGGPSLNGQLLADGMVDELCLTLAATMAGGTDERRVVTGLDHREDLGLLAVHQHDGDLLLRYVISARASGSPRASSDEDS